MAMSSSSNIRSDDTALESEHALKNQIDNNEAMIARIEDELASLRKIESAEASRNKRLREVVSRFNPKSALSLDEVLDADRETLVVAHAAVLQETTMLANNNSKLLERIHILQNELIEKNESQIEFSALDKAHKAQLAYKNELSAKIRNSENLKQTIKRQDVVIERLEEMISAKALGQYGNEDILPSPAYVLLEQEYDLLKSKNENFGQKQERLQQSLEKESNNELNDLVVNLQEQLVRQTQAFTAEITGLEMQLIELKLGIEHGYTE